VAAVVICVLGAAQTFAAASIWRNHLSFHLAQIDSAPTTWEGYYGASLELNRLGRYEDALPYAERCRQMAPQQAGCWMVLGNAWSALERRPEAISALQRSLALDSAQHQARFILGYIMMKEGRQAEAGHLMVDALAGEPDHEGRWQFVSQAVKGLGPTSPFVATLHAAAASGHYPEIASRLDALTR
jgi:tetratricopeptide (TPR) repeat protein